MNRLRDDVGDGPVAERGIQLLRAYAATPLDGEMKRRVWGAIQQTRLRAVAPRAFPRLRFAAAAIILLGLAGTAGAVITRRWIAPGLARTAAPSVDAAPGPAGTRARKVGARVAPAGDVPATKMALAEPTLTPQAAALEPIKPATRTSAAPHTGNGEAGRGIAIASSGDRSARTARTSRAPLSAAGMTDAQTPRAAARAGEADPQTAAAAARERTQVLDAMVALRRDHDGARAGLLLDAYLKEHPRGVLREEALVLAVEAADARGDGATARRLARTYQDTYPGGRFSAFARDRAAAETR